jgi:HrpA-like RNA helicase
MGNTSRLLGEAVEGARSAGAEVSEFRLRDLKMSPCLEIYGCKNEGRCVIKDDFHAVGGAVVESGGGMFYSPVFFFAVSARAHETPRPAAAPVLLAVLAFQPGDPARFPFLEAPPPASLEAGLALLRRLGALPPTGFALTERGKRLAGLPLHPRIGALLEEARRRELLEEGALLAALLGERDLLVGAGGAAAGTSHSSDLLHRRDLFLSLRAAGFAAAEARRLSLDGRAARDVERAAEQLHRIAGGRTASKRAAGGAVEEQELLRLALAGYPDRVCRRRAPGSPDAVMVGGRGVRLSEQSGVREADLFVALEAEAGRPGLHSVALVRQASAVEESMLGELFGEHLQRRQEIFFDERRGAVHGVERRLFGDLVLAEQPCAVSDEQAAPLLAEAAAAPNAFSRSSVAKPCNPVTMPISVPARWPNRVPITGQNTSALRRAGESFEQSSTKVARRFSGICRP